jgi:uncharacterized protein YodC (DUF2158 family)
VTTESQVEEAAKSISLKSGGPRVIVAKIAGAEEARVLPSRDGVVVKARFRQALELATM